jgi:small subunit ribosomal protein S8e
MGISRSSIHKRRATGGRRNHWRKSRKYELGRPTAGTKLSNHKCVRLMRVRGGNIKHRAIRLDHGNLSWGSEALSRKTRILSVVYNASSNELVRTNTLVRGAIVTVDASPFKQWYAKHYGIDLSKGANQKNINSIKRSCHTNRKINSRNVNRKLDPHLAVQFDSGKLYACLSSRPGQCGRADGYILEGQELEFYLKKIVKKKVNSA